MSLQLVADRKIEQPDEILQRLVDLRKAKHAEYGRTPYVHGHVMAALFPDGLTLTTPADHARFGILTMQVSKICRYAQNFGKGGHPDSMDDLAVYAAMLNSMDQDVVYGDADLPK